MIIILHYILNSYAISSTLFCDSNCVYLENRWCKNRLRVPSPSLTFRVLLVYAEMGVGSLIVNRFWKCCCIDSVRQISMFAVVDSSCVAAWRLYLTILRWVTTVGVCVPKRVLCSACVHVHRACNEWFITSPIDHCINSGPSSLRLHSLDYSDSDEWTAWYLRWCFGWCFHSMGALRIIWKECKSTHIVFYLLCVCVFVCVCKH